MQASVLLTLGARPAAWESLVPWAHVAVSCLQQACEMVMDILRERDQGGFGDRNEYGSRIGGGIDVRPI